MIKTMFGLGSAACAPAAAARPSSVARNRRRNVGIPGRLRLLEIDLDFFDLAVKRERRAVELVERYRRAEIHSDVERFAGQKAPATVRLTSTCMISEPSSFIVDRRFG